MHWSLHSIKVLTVDTELFDTSPKATSVIQAAAKLHFAELVSKPFTMTICVLQALYADSTRTLANNDPSLPDPTMFTSEYEFHHR